VIPGSPAFESWLEVRKRLPAESPFLRHLEETRRDIEAAADPDLALGTWLRWIEGGEEPRPAGAAGLEAATEPRSGVWDRHREFREGFIALAGASPALGENLLADWSAFRPWEWQAGWETRVSLARRIAQDVRPASDREFPGVARRFHRVECLRIAYLDCVRGLPVDQVTVQISALADTIIAECFARALAQVADRRGLRPPARGLVVLALGKLGGRELNYSSDVDLNFVRDEGFSGLEDREGKAIGDPRDVERFFTSTAERVVKLVGEFTDEGRLYRLDARLRPEGSTGRLVWSARAAVDYYYSMGRAWERQALIRMRPVAGDFALGERLRRDLDPFIFPASLSAADIAEIRGLKLQIERVAEDRGPSESQIKIGRGGIRDVEYIVQYLQLIHAARIPALKNANMFQAFELLDAHGLLKPEETDILRQGYRFLRKVEHRIQLAHLSQTHRLPDDPRDLLRLVRGLGFDAPDAFRARLEFHGSRIRKVYRLLFEEPTAPRREAEELPALLDLPGEVALRAGARAISSFGFREPERAFERLRALSGSTEDRRAIDATRTKEAFARLAGPLLREVSRQPEPDRTLANFEECTRALGARSVFYALLTESPRILQLFVEICARSSLMVETLRAYPDLFDDLVDALSTGAAFDLESLLAETDRLLAQACGGAAGMPPLEEGLFRLKHFHLLLIAVRDLERIDNLGTTLERIAEVAEALLRAVLKKSVLEAEARRGAPPAAAPRFLLLGLGKLGGQEMSYKSDLDIVVLYRGGGGTAEAASTQEHFERLSQAVLQGCGVADSLGPLLRIDMRLRPLGSHNSLAIEVGAWKQYFRGGEARNWERQAFLRARPIEGDGDLAREAMEFVRGELVLGGAAGPTSREQILADVWDMRRKLQANAKPGDLKRGEGGIMDIEFTVQALQLCHGKEHPEILTPNTPAALGKLMDAGLLEPAMGSDLLTAYQFLRWVENRISLVSEAGQSIATLAPSELESLAQKIGYKSSGEESALSIFQGELDYHRRRSRALLKQVLEVGD
jgi:glutamate-ammonia-ligase adenylyltransferase